MLMFYFKTIKKKKIFYNTLYIPFQCCYFPSKRGAKAFENPWKGEMLRKIQNGQIRFLW